MKLAAFILSFYFLLISAQPVIAGVAKLAVVCNTECSVMSVKNECAKNQESCPQEENSCPLCCCSIFQCTFCCGALVEEHIYNINLRPQSASLFPGADLILLSSYSSDCWQPPEMV